MKPRDFWLKRLRVENFKRFDTLELDFQGLNLLVGPNNSGKSTALQACTLFNFCYQACLEKRNGDLVFQKRTFGFDEFNVIPVPDPKDLWKDRRTQEANNTLIPIRVSGELYGGAKYEFEVNLRFNRFSVQINSSDPPLSQVGALNIALIPGYTGFNPREERRTAVVRRELRALGQSGTIIRNILLDLRENPERWIRFIDLLQSIFPSLHLFDPEFEEQVDRYIRVTYSEGEQLSLSRRKKQITFDIFSSGSGFHQFLQILSGILVEQTSTVLLDEPDAHLFSKLQAELYGVLKLLRDGGIQVIAATHSTELIAAASPEQIVSFTDAAPHRLHVQTEVLNAVENLGGLENLALLLIDSYRKVVIVEDKYDENLVRLFMERIFSNQEYVQLQSRLLFLHHHSRPKGASVKKMLDTLRQAFRTTKPIEVRAFVIADRDYALDEQLVHELQEYARLEGEYAANQSWHIWKRAEIENYLLVPDAIVCAIMEAVPTAATFFDPTKEKLVELFDNTVESSREAVRKRLINSFNYRNRNEKLGWEAATVTEKAEEFLAHIWHADQRLAWCDAKEVVLPRFREALQHQYNFTLTDRAIIEAMTPSHVPADLREALDKLAQFLR